METKEKFMQKLESNFQYFDKNVSYLSQVLGENPNNNFILMRVNSLKNHLQEAFEIYKKIKSANETDWNILRPFAIKIFHKIVNEFSFLIKITNQTHNKKVL